MLRQLLISVLHISNFIAIHAVKAIQKVETDTLEGELQYTCGQRVVNPINFLSFSRK